MAIDTAGKRLSIMDFGGETTMPGMPQANGAIDQLDRQHFLWLYSGIAADNPVEGGGALMDFVMFARRMMRR